MRKLNMIISACFSIALAVVPLLSYGKTGEVNVGQRVFTVAEIEEEVADHLLTELQEDRIEVILRSHKKDFPLAEEIIPRIEGITFNERSGSGHFRAKLYLTELKSESPIMLSGRFSVLKEVPVLNRRIKAGELIQASDIRWTEVPQQRLREDSIVEDGYLIGKTPKRFLQPGRQISERSVAPPRLIEKNAMITLVYNTGVIKLQTTGVALDNGAKGQVIRVKNSKSNVVVQGQVAGPNLVSVGLGEAHKSYQEAMNAL